MVSGFSFLTLSIKCLKFSFNLSTEKLLENYNYFIENLKKEKPDTIKGEFIKNIFLTSTMGISYKVGAK